MPNASSPCQFTIQIASEGFDEEELDAATRRLRREFEELPQIDSVELVQTAHATAGTKSAGGFDIGALVIATIPALLPRVIDLLQSWLKRDESRTAKLKVGDIEIELQANDAKPEQLQALLEAMAKARKT